MGEIAKIQTRELLSNEDLDVLKRSKFKDFTNPEIAFAARVSAHLQLNPMLNQIHFVKRGGAVVAQVGIDGFRLAAHRAGGYAGSDDAVFDTDSVKPNKATVTVYRMVGGERCPFTATARWNEYYPGDSQGHMWKKMPFTMLSKCAEALALRKAFPHELAGLKTDEEMEQANAKPSQADKLNSFKPDAAPKTIEAEPEVKITESDRERLVEIVNGAQIWNRAKVTAFIKEQFGIEKTIDLTKAQFDELLGLIEKDEAM